MTNNQKQNFYEEFFSNYKTAESIASEAKEVSANGPNRVKSRGNLEKLVKEVYNGGIMTENMQDSQIVEAASEVDNIKRNYAFGMFAQDAKAIIKKALVEKREKVLKNYLSLAPVDCMDKKFEEIQNYHGVIFDIEQKLKKLSSIEGEEGKEKALASFVDPLTLEMQFRNRGLVSEKSLKILKSIYMASGINGRLAMISYSRGSMKKVIENKIDENGRVKYANALLDTMLGMGKGGEGIGLAGSNLYEITK